MIGQYLLVAAIATAGCGQQTPATADFAAQRQRMVEQQLKPRGIKDERVLAAMAKVQREELFPRMCEPTRTKTGRYLSVTIRPFPSHTSWRL